MIFPLCSLQRRLGENFDTFSRTRDKRLISA